MLKDLAKKITNIASMAKTEEDLKMGVEPLIREYLSQQDDLEITPEYELKTGLRGRRDAVYGHLTIEYKKPGDLASNEKIRKAAEQLAGYLEDAAKSEDLIGEDALKRVAGACLDGENIFFLRYYPAALNRVRPLSKEKQLYLFEDEFKDIKGGFQRLGPQPITTESLDELFRYMRALHRKPLSPESLAEEFGPGTETAQNLVSTFYQALINKNSEAVKTFFEQWTKTFGIVYGEETTKVEKDIPEIAEGYALPEDVNIKHALFAIHTYFALIMKLIAAEVVSLTQQRGSLAPSVIGQMTAVSTPELKNQMDNLENGGIFRTHGIVNFLEGDFFRWYISVWDQDMARSVRQLAIKLSNFEPTTPVVRPGEARDLLKKLYQYLVPKKLRHDLGEYYTPDWIAERLLNQLGYDGNPNTRILDPACGSGTFLTIAIDRARGFMENNYFMDREPQKRKECAEKILQNIVGFDLNPLAVIAARTNYLLVLGDLIQEVRPVEIPIYICDSILTPVLQKQAQSDVMIQRSIFDQEQNVDYFYLPTSAGEFVMPKAVIEKKVLGQITSTIQECIESNYKPEEFISLTKNRVELGSEGVYHLLEELYTKIFDLNKRGKNGIWARLIKNSFAPVLQRPFDMVAGNPPWVNWESLAYEWRDLSKQLWEDYGLFSLKGPEARLGGGKKDLSMLFTYACVDYYLKPKGTLGFVITQSIFKSKGAGDGFRRFRLGKTGAYLRVMHVDDMSELQPFEGATNNTAVVILRKGDNTRYPVDYTLWRKKEGGRIALESTLEDAAKKTRRINLQATPVDENKPTSQWLTAKPYAIRALSKNKLIGKAQYTAYAGVFTGGLNGAYWVKILERRPDEILVIENLYDSGKTKVPQIKAAVEPDLIFPLIRSRDIKRWEATPSAHIILAQNPETRSGWQENKMKTDWPLTYNYLKNFESLLWKRKSSGLNELMKKSGFYAMFAVGPYTMAPYKVMWRQMYGVINTTVTEPIEDKFLGMKTPLTQHVVSFVPFNDKDEAHYFSALMNSSIVSLISLTCFTGKGFGTPGLMDYINIPKYQNDNRVHKYLSRLSQDAHALAKTNDKIKLQGIERDIDISAAELWNISKKELESIQRSLKELQ